MNIEKESIEWTEEDDKTHIFVELPDVILLVMTLFDFNVYRHPTSVTFFHLFMKQQQQQQNVFHCGTNRFGKLVFRQQLFVQTGFILCGSTQID